MTRRTVLVTGVGGNVGQGILRNLRHTHKELRLVGTNTDAATAGNHLCDSVHKVPPGLAPGFVGTIKRICQDESVDLIIPSTDFESFDLALHRDQLPTLACSPARTAEVFLDKYLTSIHFASHGIPFAVSVLPDDYREEFEETVVKPRRGRGSRNVHINPPDPGSFVSAEYLVQRLYRGREITTAFYVRRDGALHGHITFERTLSDGATSTCVVTREHDQRLEVMIAKLMSSIVIRGSCNLQSIVTDGGEIVPFEVNARISGTNSVRANFGFEDVRYTIEEYLFDVQPSKPEIRPGAAVRILMDVIYPGASSLDDIHDIDTPHYLY